MKDDAKIEIENFISPGPTKKVDRQKYMAMHDALLNVLPDVSTGITVAEAKARLLEHLPDALFPNGDKAGWWLKAVQLDLEAKKIIARAPSKPVRLYRSSGARRS